MPLTPEVKAATIELLKKQKNVLYGSYRSIDYENNHECYCLVGAIGQVIDAYDRPDTGFGDLGFISRIVCTEAELSLQEFYNAIEANEDAADIGEVIAWAEANL